VQLRADRGDQIVYRETGARTCEANTLFQTPIRGMIVAPVVVSARLKQ